MKNVIPVLAMILKPDVPFLQYCVLTHMPMMRRPFVLQQDLKRNGLPSGLTAVVNLAGHNLMGSLKKYGQQLSISSS